MSKSSLSSRWESNNKQQHGTIADSDMIDQEAAITSFSYSKPKSSSNPSTLPSTPMSSKHNQIPSSTTNGLMNTSTSDRSNHLVSSKNTTPTMSSTGLGGASPSPSPVKRFSYGPGPNQASNGSGGVSPNTFSPFTRPISPAQGVAGELRSSPNAADLGRFSRVKSAETISVSGAQKHPPKGIVPIDRSNDVTRVNQRDPTVIEPPAVNSSTSASNKRRHEVIGRLYSEKDKSEATSFTLKGVPQELEQQKASAKRQKINLSTRTGVDALRGSSSDLEAQRSSNLNSAQKEKDHQTNQEEKGVSSPVASSFDPDHQEGSSLLSNNAAGALVRSPSGLSKTNSSTLGSSIGDDWYSKALHHNSIIVAQLQAGNEEKQAFELKVTKMSGDLEQLRLKDHESCKKLSCWEKNYKVVVVKSKSLKESAKAVKSISDGTAASAVNQIKVFQNSVGDLKMMYHQKLPEIGQEKYKLDSEFNKIRGDYSQKVRELEAELQVALDKALVQRESTDQARFDLAEAKDKIKDLDSHIRAQQLSLEEKSSKLIPALSAATQSHQDLKSICSEIDQALLDFEDLNSDLVAKEADLATLRQRTEELLSKDASFASALEQQKVEVATLEHQKSELKIQISDSEEKVKKLTQDATAASDAHKNALESIKILQREKEINSTQVDQLSASVKDLRQQISISEKAVSETETNLAVTSEKLASIEVLLENMTKEIESLQADRARAEGLAGNLSTEKETIISLENSAKLVQQQLASVLQILEKESQDGRIRSEENSKLVQSIDTQLVYQKKLAQERQDKILSLQTEIKSLQDNGGDSRLQEVELSSLKEEAESEEARVRVLTSEVESAKSLEAASSQTFSSVKIKVQEADDLVREKNRELEAALNARDTFSERVSQGHSLEGIELEIYNTIGNSRAGPLRKECFKLSNSVKSLEAQIEAERKKSEEKMAKVQKEIQERDAKLKVVGGSTKSKPHLDVNAQDDEEEDQDQQGPAEDSPTLNRVRSLERQGSIIARACEEPTSSVNDETDSVASVDLAEVEQFSLNQQSRTQIATLHSGRQRGAPAGVALRQGNARKSKPSQAQAQSQSQAPPASQRQRGQAQTQLANKRTFGSTRR